MYTVKITNDYSDGHRSQCEELVEGPASEDADDLTAWFEDVVWPLTGDGHGADSSLHSCYTAEIISCDVKEHLGEWYEWV